MKTMKVVLIAALLTLLSACNTTTTGSIVGSWKQVSGLRTDSIKFSPDGTFTAKLIEKGDDNDPFLLSGTYVSSN